MTTTRRIAIAVGGGTAAALTTSAAGLAGVMWAETKIAKRRIPIAVAPPPTSDGTTWAAPGVDARQAPIRIALLGDSLAAGYGAQRPRDTPAARIAYGISEAVRRPVHVTNVAAVGAESPDLPAQVGRLGAVAPDLAIVLVGANDVTALTKPAVAAPFVEDTVRALCALGSEVVVGTCPDFGTIRPISQPLRAYARRLSRQMAREQTVAVVRAGGRTVSLGDLLGPLFMTHLDLFADDRFHPSAAGYAEAAAAMLPSCLDALGAQTRVSSASTFTTRLPKTVTRAAAQAVARPGTEVLAAERFGRSEGRHGHPVAKLRRRRPLRVPLRLARRLARQHRRVRSDTPGRGPAASGGTIEEAVSS